MNGLRWGQGQKKRHGVAEWSACQETIISAATVCYAKLGLETTTTDIALQANITRQTIYKYFGSAETLRLRVVARIWDGMTPEHGLAPEWLESLRSAREYRLGKLTLSEDLFLDMQNVLLTNVDSPVQEGCARLFLSYLQIDPLTGDPLAIFTTLLTDQPAPADVEPPETI